MPRDYKKQKKSILKVIVVEKVFDIEYINKRDKIEFRVWKK